MTLTLHFYGPLGDLFAGAQKEIDLKEGSTAGEVLETLIEVSGLQEVRRMPLRFAVNDEFAAANTILKPGDHLGLLPPVSGG